MSEIKKLGDIASYINGYPFKPEDRGTEGLPIIRIQDLTGNAYDLGFYNGEYPERIEINDGDVLISWSASLGVYIWNGGKALLNQHIFKVVFDKVRVDKQYFVYAVQYNLAEMESKTHGATMKHIVKKDFDSIIVPFPSLEKQHEIAGILSRTSGIVDSLRTELQRMDDLIKARFVEMFDADAPTVKLGSICKMINGDRGKNYPSGNDFVSEGIPFVNAGHLQNRVVNFSGMNYITEEKYNLLSQGKMQSGDILYCLRGSLGKHALVTIDQGAIASSLVILRCDTKRVLPQFLLYAIETPEIEKQLKAANNGSSQPNLSAASVKAYEIKLPSVVDQQAFVSFVSQVDKSKVVGQTHSTL